MAISCPVAALSDHNLLERLHTLVRRSNEVTADLIEHLAEVDRRKLYLVRASSLHDYCVRRLGLSDAAAYKRIAVARLTQRFADVLGRIRGGRLHLSGAVTIGPHLTNDNCDELLALAEGKSQRELERVLAVRFPQPDVAEFIRKLPTKALREVALPAKASGLESDDLSAPPVTDSASSSRAPKAPESPDFEEQSNPTERTQGSSVSGSTRPTAKSGRWERLHTRPSGSSDAGRIEALSRASYAVRFTASERLHDKIREARALVSHTLPKGELPALFELALDLLIAERKKRRFGMRPQRSSKAPTQRSSKAPTQRSSKAPTQRSSKAPTLRTSNAPTRQSSNAQSPKPAAPATAPIPSKRSRYVPAAVRRQVAERDELRCAYVDPDGERCAECRFLEFEHRLPHARGGQSDSETLRLFCRGHNQLMARREFGAEHIQRAIETHRARACRESLVSPPHRNSS